MKRVRYIAGQVFSYALLAIITPILIAFHFDMDGVPRSNVATDY